MPPVVGISGSYGGLNVGDEAILSSAIRQLRAACPGVEIVAFSRNAEHTRRHQDVDRALNTRTALRDQILPEVGRLDLLLLGGGGILYDSEAQAYLREVRLAHELGIPTFAFAVGIGPLKERDERRAVRDGLNRMAGITVREVTAKRLCEEIGVRVPVEVTADPALLLEPCAFTDAMLRTEAIPSDRRLVGLSVREPGAAAPGLAPGAYHALVADAADFMADRFDADVVFVPMERVDRNESHQVIARMLRPERAHVLRTAYDPRQIMGLVGRFQAVAGMRLHFLIFAAVMGVPFMALPYASKVQDLVDSLGIAEHMAAGDARTGAFLAALDRLWDQKDIQRRHLAGRLADLQALARRTVPLALACIGHGPGRDAAPPSRTGEDLANPPIAF